MDHFAQGIVAGFAVSVTIPAMYYFNKAALGTLFAVNRAIGKAIARVIIPPDEHTCNFAGCSIFCSNRGDCDNYRCYECENPKYTTHNEL